MATYSVDLVVAPLLVILAWRARPHSCARCGRTGDPGRGRRLPPVDGRDVPSPRLPAVAGSVRRVREGVLALAAGAVTVAAWFVPMVLAQPGGFTAWESGHPDRVGGRGAGQFGPRPRRRRSRQRRQRSRPTPWSPCCRSRPWPPWRPSGSASVPSTGQDATGPTPGRTGSCRRSERSRPTQGGHRRGPSRSRTSRGRPRGCPGDAGTSMAVPGPAPVTASARRPGDVPGTSPGPPCWPWPWPHPWPWSRSCSSPRVATCSRTCPAR